jgi:hypothetical protein
MQRSRQTGLAYPLTSPALELANRIDRHTCSVVLAFDERKQTGKPPIITGTNMLTLLELRRIENASFFSCDLDLVVNYLKIVFAFVRLLRIFIWC